MISDAAKKNVMLVFAQTFFCIFSQASLWTKMLWGTYTTLYNKKFAKKGLTFLTYVSNFLTGNLKWDSCEKRTFRSDFSVDEWHKKLPFTAISLSYCLASIARQGALQSPPPPVLFPLSEFLTSDLNNMSVNADFALKDQCHEIFDFWFFHESISPKPLSILYY